MKNILKIYRNVKEMYYNIYHIMILLFFITFIVVTIFFKEDFWFLHPMTEKTLVLNCIFS